MINYVVGGLIKKVIKGRVYSSSLHLVVFSGQVKVDLLKEKRNVLRSVDFFGILILLTRGLMKNKLFIVCVCQWKYEMVVSRHKACMVQTGNHRLQLSFDKI